MKKVIILIIILLVIALAFFTFKGKESSYTQNKKIDRVRVPLKDTKYFVKKEEDEKASLLILECSEFLKDLTELNQEELLQAIRQNEISLSKDCYGKLVEKELIKDLKIENCSLNPKDSPRVTESCIPILSIIKSLYIAELVKGRPLKNLSDSELAALAVNAFMGEKFNLENFKKNIKIFEELYARYRDDTNVAEAYIGYLLVGAKTIKLPDLESEVERIFEEFPSDNFKLERLKLVQELINENEESADFKFAELEQKYPNEPEIDYYRAAHAWRQKNRLAAENYLNSAIKKGKNCTYCTPELYKQIRIELKKAELGAPDIFPISLGLNFENL